MNGDVAHTDESFIGRHCLAVQFHVGVQFLTMVKTGLNAAHDGCEIRVFEYGVHVKIKGRDYMVPFSNVIRVDLA